MYGGELPDTTWSAKELTTWGAGPGPGEKPWHWVRAVQTWTLPTLVGIHGHAYTLKQLCNVWKLVVKRGQEESRLSNLFKANNLPRPRKPARVQGMGP